MITGVIVCGSDKNVVVFSEIRQIDRSLSGKGESGVGSRKLGVGSREGRSLFLKAATEGRSLGWGNGELGGRSLFLNADELEGRAFFLSSNRVQKSSPFKGEC
jgi:hypothetical protein